MKAIQRKTLEYLKIITNTRLMETHDTIICKIYYWYKAYILVQRKVKLIVIAKLTDLPSLSCAKQKVIKHIAQGREVKSENYR